MDSIKRTIFTLIDSGAAIKNVRQVPHPYLIMALFSNNTEIVRKFLIAGSDPTSTLPYEEGLLSTLHILCLQSPGTNSAPTIRLLLRHGANPNVSCSMEWFKNVCAEWNIDKVIDTSNESFQFNQSIITPLQLLILRPDTIFNQDKSYFCEIIQSLVPVTNPNILFFGHTPLSIAILKNDTDLVQCLLTAGLNPNIKLESDDGGILFQLMSKKRFDIEKTPVMLDLLLQHGIDKFLIKNFEGTRKNIIDYANSTLEEMVKDSVPVQIEKGKKQNKKDKTPQPDLNKQLISEYLASICKIKETMKTSIIRHIYGKLTRAAIEKSMADCDQIKLPSLEMFSKAQEYLPKTAFYKCISSHFEQGLKMHQTYFIHSLKLLYEELDSDDTSAIEVLTSSKRLTKEKQIGKQSNTYARTFKDPAIKKKMLANSMLYPELDTDSARYKVCYNCCQSGSQLTVCPTCKLTYFCANGCLDDTIGQCDPDEPEMLCGICKQINCEAIQNRDEIILQEQLENDPKALARNQLKKSIQTQAAENLNKLKTAKEMKKETEFKEKSVKKEKSASAKDAGATKKGGKSVDTAEKSEKGAKKKDKKDEKTTEKSEKGVTKKDKKDEDAAKKGGRDASATRKGGKDEVAAKKGGKDADATKKSRNKADATKKGEKTADTTEKGQIDTTKKGKRDDKEKGTKKSNTAKDGKLKTQHEVEQNKGKIGQEKLEKGMLRSATGGSRDRENAYESKIKEKPTEASFAGKGFADELLKTLVQQAGLTAELILPYVVLRNGSLYYKIYGDKPIKENYSLN